MQYLKDKVREKIYNAAVEEFKNFGYQDASIRNIANNAGISLGNIYRYYANKEALYIAVVQPLIDSVKVFVEQKYFVVGDSLQTIAENALEFMVEHADEIVILRRGNTQYYKQFSEYLESVTAEKIKMIMDEGTAEAKIKNPDLTYIIARSFLHCLFDIIDGTKDNDLRKEYVKEIITFYFGHLNTRFGN